MLHAHCEEHVRQLQGTHKTPQLSNQRTKQLTVTGAHPRIPFGLLLGLLLLRTWNTKPAPTGSLSAKYTCNHV